jgi:hypothetical protein
VFSEVCHRTGEKMEKGVYEPEEAIVACRSPTAKFVRDEQRGTEEFTTVTHSGSEPESDVPREEQNALKQAVADHVEFVEADQSSTETVELDQRTAERLRNLGYAE